MRSILAALLLAVALVAPASAAPTATAPTLTVTAIVMDDPSAPVADNGRIDFATNAKGSRLLVWLCYADWGTPSNDPLLSGVTESSTPMFRKGEASVWFRNGLNYNGIRFCQNWTAWVALKDDWRTPLSNVVTGSF